MARPEMSAPTPGARRRCSQSAEGDKIGRVILDITPERGRH